MVGEKGKTPLKPKSVDKSSSATKSPHKSGQATPAGEKKSGQATPAVGAGPASGKEDVTGLACSSSEDQPDKYSYKDEGEQAKLKETRNKLSHGERMRVPYHVGGNIEILKRWSFTGYGIIDPSRVNEYCSTKDNVKLQTMWLSDYARFYRHMPMIGLQKVVAKIFEILNTASGKDEAGKAEHKGLLEDLKIKFQGVSDPKISGVVGAIDDYLTCLNVETVKPEMCDKILMPKSTIMGWIFKKVYQLDLDDVTAGLVGGQVANQVNSHITDAMGQSRPSSSVDVMENLPSSFSVDDVNNFANVMFDFVTEAAIGALGDPIMIGGAVGFIAGLLAGQIFEKNHRTATMLFLASSTVKLGAALIAAGVLSSWTGAGAAIACAGIVTVVGSGVTLVLQSMYRNLPTLTPDKNNAISLYFGDGIINRNKICVEAYNKHDPLKWVGYEQVRYYGNENGEGAAASIQSGERKDSGFQVSFFLNHCRRSIMPRGEDSYKVLVQFGQLYHEDALFVCPLASRSSSVDPDNYDIIWARGGFNEKSPGGINRIDSKTLKALNGRILNVPPISEETKKVLAAVEEAVTKSNKVPKGK
jgi:hypothetical protein